MNNRCATNLIRRSGSLTTPAQSNIKNTVFNPDNECGE
jgi:hypothetical protein